VEWAVNKCDGRRWRELRNGQIEVEGDGVPMMEPGSPRFGYMEQTWKNWGPYFRSSAARHGLPVSWLLAIASVETGFVSHNPELQASIVSPAKAQGVMQLLAATARAYGGLTSAERTDPEKNIDSGATFIRALVDGPTGPELPHIGSAYNAGPGSGSDGVRCSTGRNEWNMVADHNYPRQIVEYNNAAIEYLRVNRRFALAAVGGGVLALAGLGMAYAIWTGKAKKLEHKFGL
jgi:hypothetical protein